MIYLSITSSTFEMLVVGVVWKINGRPQFRPPVEPKLVGGIELKNATINYLGGLTKGAKFQICNRPGVVWAIG